MLKKDKIHFKDIQSKCLGNKVSTYQKNVEESSNNLLLENC